MVAKASASSFPQGPTQDLFELLERVQSSRLDDQRCVLPPYFSQVRRHKEYLIHLFSSCYFFFSVALAALYSFILLGWLARLSTVRRLSGEIFRLGDNGRRVSENQLSHVLSARAHFFFSLWIIVARFFFSEESRRTFGNRYAVLALNYY